jgi:hypothetical protein
MSLLYLVLPQGHAGLRNSHKGFGVRSCKNRKRGEEGIGTYIGAYRRD